MVKNSLKNWLYYLYYLLYDLHLHYMVIYISLIKQLNIVFKHCMLI